MYEQSFKKNLEFQVALCFASFLWGRAGVCPNSATFEKVLNQRLGWGQPVLAVWGFEVLPRLEETRVFGSPAELFQVI